MSDSATEVPTNLFLDLGKTIQDSARVLGELYSTSGSNLQKVIFNYALERVKSTYGSMASCQHEIEGVCKILQGDRETQRITRLYDENVPHGLSPVLLAFRQAFGMDVPTAKLLYDLWHHAIAPAQCGVSER